MNRRTHRALAATTALLLGTGAALAGALPASAAVLDVTTPSVWWDNVDDAGPAIEDAQIVYPDFLGSGSAVTSWTDEDAFDGFLQEIDVHEGAESAVLSFTQQSATVNSTGVSTFVYDSSYDFISTVHLDLTVTLEISGSYARWTLDSTTDGTVTITTFGYLGSDSTTEYTAVGADGLVSSDGIDASDPVIGYQISSGAFDVTAPSDIVRWASDAGAPASLTVALQDYDVCDQAAVVADMAARVPSFSSTFGQNIPLLETSCLTVGAAASFPSNQATDQTIPVTDVSAGELDDWWGDPYFDSAWTNLFVSGLPAGLTLTFDPDAMTLHLTGQAASGTYPVKIGFADEDGELFAPLVKTLALTVTGPALAATGSVAPSPLVVTFAALLVVAGAIALGARRILTRR